MTGYDPNTASAVIRRRRDLIEDLVVAMAGLDRLEDDVADRFAEHIESFRSFDGGPAAYLDAIEATDDYRDVLATVGPHSEASVRRFLPRIAAALRSRQPWSEPPLRRLPSTEWASFTVPVGWVDDNRISARQKLALRFETIEDDGRQRQVLLLHLRTGEEVGLFAPEVRTERGLQIRQRGDADPATLLKHFGELTGYPESALKPVD